MSLGVFYLLLTGFDVPDTPGSDYLHIGRESLYRELETHLIVALARAAVADSVCALGLGYLNESLRDYRAGKRGAEKIVALVYGAGFQCREDVVLNELLFKILNIELGSAGLESLLLESVELRALATSAETATTSQLL